MNQFNAKLDIIVGNPFVFVPSEILNSIFEKANKNKGTIPIRGNVNGKPYQQTLLRYSGEWRLYINMKMLKDSPKRIGEIIEVEIEFDPSDRTIKPHPKLVNALTENKEANNVFESLSPSYQKEIVRYISFLKTEKSLEKNVNRAINFLLGKERFIGRDKP
ncbi:YdeI/OmpD-associated family protein [Brumimicrobium mesophilum]|uniref:YdeI/OmpD-associated family protein n=1 Tax=Brumimicrobium mesophilum TaxID=392717 RepID=UPI000D142A21|nr:YdeI/OmpD-associated family protein [Brumimicrobium mesophilum]